MGVRVRVPVRLRAGKHRGSILNTHTHTHAQALTFVREVIPEQREVELEEVVEATHEGLNCFGLQSVEADVFPVVHEVYQCLESLELFHI